MICYNFYAFRSSRIFQNFFLRPPRIFCMAFLGPSFILWCHCTGGNLAAMSSGGSCGWEGSSRLNQNPVPSQIKYTQMVGQFQTKHLQFRNFAIQRKLLRKYPITGILHISKTNGLNLSLLPVNKDKPNQICHEKCAQLRKIRNICQI